jgi:hypothetical protein
MPQDKKKVLEDPIEYENRCFEKELTLRCLTRAKTSLNDFIFEYRDFPELAERLKDIQAASGRF